jgi:ribonuclease HII
MNSLKKFDTALLSRKIKLIGGTDEAGRGPIAGPVVAAAVMFDRKSFHPLINDSKQVNETNREKLFDWIIGNCLCFGVGIIEHDEIDKINILQASLKAMKISVEQLKPIPDLIIIDGNNSFHSEIKTKTIIKGDAKSFSIAAASIIAKVTRDRIMKIIAEEYPEYLWHNNKGYPTKEHIAAVRKYGVSVHHRKTFLSRILIKECQDELF